MPCRQGFFDPSTTEYLNPSADRRVVLITGGNFGIGWYTVLHLFLHGYVVYLAGRNETKIANAINEIKEEARKRIKGINKDENEGRFLGELNEISMDLTDLESVVKGARKFKKQESKLHILINNAGVMGLPYETTKDGFELQYQSNYVGHLLLTSELLPCLKRVVQDSQVQPRVVFLTSIGHNLAFRYFDPEENVDRLPGLFWAYVRYGIAKTAAIQATKKLATQEPEILFLAVHPGIICKTGLFDYIKNSPVLGYISTPCLKVVDTLFGISPEDGCLATLRAATDTSLTSKDSGSYLVTGGRITNTSKSASNEQNIKRTWDWTLAELRKRKFDIAF